MVKYEYGLEKIEPVHEFGFKDLPEKQKVPYGERIKYIANRVKELFEEPDLKIKVEANFPDSDQLASGSLLPTLYLSQNFKMQNPSAEDCISYVNNKIKDRTISIDTPRKGIWAFGYTDRTGLKRAFSYYSIYIITDTTGNPFAVEDALKEVREGRKLKLLLNIDHHPLLTSKEKAKAKYWSQLEECFPEVIYFNSTLYKDATDSPCATEIVADICDFILGSEEKKEMEIFPHEIIKRGEEKRKKLKKRRCSTIDPITYLEIIGMAGDIRLKENEKRERIDNLTGVRKYATTLKGSDYWWRMRYIIEDALYFNPFVTEDIFYSLIKTAIVGDPNFFFLSSEPSIVRVREAKKDWDRMVFYKGKNNLRSIMSDRISTQHVVARIISKDTQIVYGGFGEYKLAGDMPLLQRYIANNLKGNQPIKLGVIEAREISSGGVIHRYANFSIRCSPQYHAGELCGALGSLGGGFGGGHETAGGGFINIAVLNKFGMDLYDLPTILQVLIDSPELISKANNIYTQKSHEDVIKEIIGKI
jgi:hypothetical protein